VGNNDNCCSDQNHVGHNQQHQPHPQLFHQDLICRHQQMISVQEAAKHEKS